MSKLTLDNLIIAVDAAVKDEAEFFGVLIDTGLRDNEVIVNTVRSMVNGKLMYYLKSYNENLELKACPDIKIIGFTYGNSFNDIQDDLLTK